MAVFITCAVVLDLRTYRIPNLLNGAGCLTGMIIQAAEHGIKGVLGSLVGMLIPVGVLFVLFACRIVGAGDIKLLAMIGSYVRADIWLVVVLAFLITAAYGAVVLICNAVRTGAWSLTRIHLSVPIAVGAMIVVFGGEWIGL